MGTDSDDFSTSMSDDECELLRAALDWGYFAVPRRVTLDELARGLRIPDEEASGRLRRAMTKTFVEHRETLESRLDEGERPPPLW